MKKPLSVKELTRHLEDLLNQSLDDKALRAGFEKAASEPTFPGLTWFWGPELYRRNRILFRPFILSHFGTWQFSPPLFWSRVSWSGETGKRLEAWLQEVDAGSDIELFKRLYQWKITPSSGWKIDPGPVRKDLLERFSRANSPAERATLLQKFDLWFELDEPSALSLYKMDPQRTGPFIQKHLPMLWSWFGGQKRELWRNLFDAAIQAKDTKTAYCLYRRQIPIADWETEVIELCGKIRDADALCESLELRHPQGFSLDLGNAYFKILENRGMEIWPYLRNHLFNIRQGWIFRTGYDSILDLAKKQGWWPLWAGLIRACGNFNGFNKEISDLVDNRDLPEKAIQERLLLIAGVGGEWNFPGLGLARVIPLSDPAALKLYGRFPHLIRGPFKLHLAFTHGATYPKTIERFLETKEEELIDYLASRAITRIYWGGNKEEVAAAERLSAYYETLRHDPLVFSARAAAVLGSIPAFAIYDYHQLIRENRLARLLFERSIDFWLQDSRVLPQLVEAPEIHVQALAYRILAQDRPEGARAANENLPVLIGTLLRPLHRKTRILAFKALENAATDGPSARRILARAREAFDLPDSHYPKEKLLGLVAQLLRRFPELRGPAESPTVYATEAT